MELHSLKQKQNREKWLCKNEIQIISCLPKSLRKNGLSSCFTATLATACAASHQWNVLQFPRIPKQTGPPSALPSVLLSARRLSNIFPFPAWINSPSFPVAVCWAMTSAPGVSSLCSRSPEHSQDLYLSQGQTGPVFTVCLWDCRLQWCGSLHPSSRLSISYGSLGF